MTSLEEGANVPFPPSGEFVKSIRQSSRALRETSNIKIESSSIIRLLLSPSFITSFQRVSKAHGLAFPLNFPSVVAELNLLATLSLLNFASGYRVPLHEQTKAGAWDNVRKLVFSLFITSSGSSDWLSAKGMQEIGEGTIIEHMRVSVHVEKPHELPGVTFHDLGGPMHKLVQLITKTLNSTGEILVKSGYRDLGSFVLEALREGQRVVAKPGQGPSSGLRPDVDTVLERIVRAIPGFRDMEVINGQPVYIFKKALFLLHAINLRFGSSNAVPVPDTSNLPIFADNVVPSMLVYLGVLDLSSSPLATVFPDRSSEMSLLLSSSEHAGESVNALLHELPVNGPTLTREQSYIMRAAAVDACELIVKAAKELDVKQHINVLPEGVKADDLGWINALTTPDLDMWLWAVAKDRPDYRQLERFEYRDTVMF